MLTALKSPRLILALISAGLFAALIFLWSENGKLQQKLGVLEASVEIAHSTNVKTLASFDQAKLANDLCNERWERAEDTNALVLDNLNKVRAQLRVDSQRRENDLRRIFSEESCNTLGQIDISAACPALAERLRERAQTLHGGEDGDDRDPRPPANSGVFVGPPRP